MLGGFRLRNKIYDLVWPLSQLTNSVSMHPMRALQLRALNDTVDYLEENMPEAIGMRTQRNVIQHGVETALPVEGCYCEFGVFQAESLRFIGDLIGSTRAAHGFDSFEGLPSAWAGHDMKKGDFSLEGKLPKVRDNTRLHKGWFDDSIPEWKKQNDDKIAFLHVDCDLYLSTKIIFDLLADRLQAGTVIVFDEYFNYPSWRLHEFKAFQEFVKARKVKYTYLAYAKYNVAIKIDEINGA